MVPVRDGAFAWIDGDHGGLTLLMDRLVEAASAPAGHDAVQDLLLLLVDASTDHFSSEQELMRAVDYPAYEGHASEHDWFLGHVSRLLENHSRGKAHLTLELARSLKPWLQEHTQTHDEALLEYARAYDPSGLSG